ncbi:hypothetical protein KC19_12G108600 [Ceratodon purpureus]|uniref:Uncharacterized protein n=1 Tax=Ceratodon purpureus TaxID=3225 RepID=A0A8T0G740_CERPU|nr:hypothetical protein KC19_12G108600 [Ceratodon purpureus]
MSQCLHHDPHVLPIHLQLHLLHLLHLLPSSSCLLLSAHLCNAFIMCVKHFPLNFLHKFFH